MKRILFVFFIMITGALCVHAEDAEGFKLGDTTWKFTGEIRFMYTDQTSFDHDWFHIDHNFIEGTDLFNRAYQRYRFGVEASFTDALSAHFEIQVGDEQWGNKNYNEREVNLRTRLAYLQFKPELFGGNTTFRVGLQGYDDIFQYSVYSDEAVGIIINHANDTFNANIGYLALRDDDVDAGTEEGLLDCSETLFLFDMNYKMNDALTVKAAFYYDYLRDFYIGAMAPWNGSAQYRMAYYGAGLDYMLNDTMSFGGHFVASSGTLTLYNNEVDPVTSFDFDMGAWFAYTYAQYTMDKFSVKLNFGYTPFKIEEESITNWNGAFVLLDFDPQLVHDPRVFYGNQWQTAYGLEYYGRGDVCDRQAVNSGYGGMYGLMVISANLSYDFAFANFGILRSTDSTEETTFYKSPDSSIGTEIDLGVKTNIIDGLQFKAVYAMFFAGDFWKFNVDEVELENAHEMSMQLQYSF